MIFQIHTFRSVQRRLQNFVLIWGKSHEENFKYTGCISLACNGAAKAAEQWFTGGHLAVAAAVAEFAKAFDAQALKWVDGAIAGGGGTNAIPAVVSRLLGGDPMGATQFNHGRQTEDLIQEGLFLDLTELSEKAGAISYSRARFWMPAPMMASCIACL